MDDCGWKVPIQITPDSFTDWRSARAESARTLNHYLQGMVSFLNWMERSGRVKANPLKHVCKTDERGQRRRPRRAFTDEELRKLVEGSGPRGIIYLTAARTGLWQEELRQLAWADLSLDAGAPFVVVREASAKNKKEERVCLVPEVVERLRSYRLPDFEPGALVFPNGIPRASRLKVDAKRNGIEYRDELGGVCRFSRAALYLGDVSATERHPATFRHEADAAQRYEAHCEGLHGRNAIADLRRNQGFASPVGPYTNTRTDFRRRGAKRAASWRSERREGTRGNPRQWRGLSHFDAW